mgnify:CR=1 FL=1
MKATIIGTGDIDIIRKNSKIGEKELEELLERTAKLVANLGIEILILPARGIPYKFAQLYKKFGGKKVVGVIPSKCPFYGDYTEEIIGDYLDIIDERKEFDSWYDVDGNIATLGDCTLCFGSSAGVIADRSEMKYNLKYKNKDTRLIIFENTISRRLHKEVEASVRPIYINSVPELEEELK